MGKVLEDRRDETKSRFKQLQNELRAADQLAANKACVYATGSFGRDEASKHSDLDLFIIGTGKKDRRELSRLEEICIKAELIKAVQKFGIQEFSNDGEYLKHYTEQDLIETLGKLEDDANNTFTARLLMLLESKPLVGEKGIYERAIANVIEFYWRDYPDNKNKFIPAFQANDILRLWRTFCVNYEARTRTGSAEEKAKRKAKNYKLKNSRLLTCYSALLYLLAIYVARKTVSQGDAISMTGLSPTARLEWLLGRKDLKSAHQTVRDLLHCYEGFLEATDYSPKELTARFLDPANSKQYSLSANRLGNLAFKAIETIGQRSDFHRVLVV
ncbi:MAG TPA: nucleotidyltransferase domain-containing protein [Methylomirabilota bacterium]|nr:nucleotidyltransferase domain-containing protein [Methylomirabilota bacterium]